MIPKNCNWTGKAKNGTKIIENFSSSVFLVNTNNAHTLQFSHCCSLGWWKQASSRAFRGPTSVIGCWFLNWVKVYIVHATVLFVIMRRAPLILTLLNVIKVVCGSKTNRRGHQLEGHNNSHGVQLLVAVTQFAFLLFGFPLGSKPFPITFGTMRWRGLPRGLLVRFSLGV